MPECSPPNAASWVPPMNDPAGIRATCTPDSYRSAVRRHDETGQCSTSSRHATPGRNTLTARTPPCVVTPVSYRLAALKHRADQSSSRSRLRHHADSSPVDRACDTTRIRPRSIAPAASRGFVPGRGRSWPAHGSAAMETVAIPSCHPERRTQIHGLPPKQPRS